MGPKIYRSFTLILSSAALRVEGSHENSCRSLRWTKRGSRLHKSKINIGSKISNVELKQRLWFILWARWSDRWKNRNVDQYHCYLHMFRVRNFTWFVSCCCKHWNLAFRNSTKICGHNANVTIAEKCNVRKGKEKKQKLGNIRMVYRVLYFSLTLPTAQQNLYFISKVSNDCSNRRNGYA